MDLSEYTPMFLAESREHLQQLNLAVVRIEETPNDTDTVNEIFRIAHSMKGASATMGFSAMAALTHEMEDVFELLRQRSGGLPKAAIDVLFECLDALEATIASIESTGAEELDPAELITRLKGLVRARSSSQKADRTGGAAELPPLEIVVEAAQGRRVVRVEAELADDVSMPSVRAFMVLASLAEHGVVLSSAPGADKVDAFEGRRIEAWLATEHGDSDVEAAVVSVADVARASIVEATAQEIADASRAAQHAAERAAEQTDAKKTASVRVEAHRLDALLHAMGELVVHRTQVQALCADAHVPGLVEAMAELTRTSQALQHMVMQVRMIPVEAVLLRLPRLVRDLSSSLAKQVDLQLVGKGTELDRTVVDALGDPLVHLVRNALDHGLEPADERVRAGKDPTGTLTISAAHAGGNVVIEVRDDGRGIDPVVVGTKALAKGIIDQAQLDALDSRGAAELLFAPGFSTADTTSEISGRGVGMDAVRTTIRDLGGEVLLTSELGAGTCAQIRLPLTLAIMNALLVDVAGEPFAIPLDRVLRTVALANATVVPTGGTRRLVWEDQVVPIVDAGDAFSLSAPCDGAHAVVCRTTDGVVALVVSGLVGQRELVTRPLPAPVAGARGLSGAAVLTSGEIALIVDCDAIEPPALLAVAA